MDSPDNRIDLQFLREMVRKFMADHEIRSMAVLGRVLDPSLSSCQGQGDKARRFLRDAYLPNLEEVGNLADWMGCSFEDLLRPISQVTMGDHSANFTQSGNNPVVNIGDQRSIPSRVDELSEEELFQAASKLVKMKSNL